MIEFAVEVSALEPVDAFHEPDLEVIDPEAVIHPASRKRRKHSRSGPVKRLGLPALTKAIVVWFGASFRARVQTCCEVDEQSAQATYHAVVRNALSESLAG